MPTLQQLQKLSAVKLAAIAGVLASCTTIFIFAGDIYDAVDRLTVTDAELVVSEQRIIRKIQSEAVLTRGVFIRDLEERKTKLTEKLDDTENPGRIAQLLEQIKELNARIDELKGE